MNEDEKKLGEVLKQIYAEHSRKCLGLDCDECELQSLSVSASFHCDYISFVLGLIERNLINIEELRKL